MTSKEATQWVRDHYDDEELDDEELEEVFAAIYGRYPDDDDMRDGLWSLVCAAYE
jgi:hypothetical protein